MNPIAVNHDFLVPTDDLCKFVIIKAAKGNVDSTRNMTFIEPILKAHIDGDEFSSGFVF